jgi:hypothetical protein
MGHPSVRARSRLQQLDPLLMIARIFLLFLPIATVAFAADEPRATLGDSVTEPDRAQRLTITVGPANADLVGATR